MLVVIAVVCLLCAVVPAGLFAANLRLYVEPPAIVGDVPAVSVLIPARNEAHAIEAAVRSVLASTGVGLEVVVMDDASTDGTGAVVQRLIEEDSRVRLEHAPPLPAGWNGKQHACWALAQAARYPVLCFMDADVRLEPGCVWRMAGFLVESQAGLVSGFPRQVTGTWMEWMLLPLIHFVLLGFLPLARMRAGTDPRFAAGCGQFLMVRAQDYFATGGHVRIKETMHDGLRLPRLLREHGFRTDLADLTELARCRMYTSAGQVWQGLAKNATEGLASPGRIVPVSLLLVMGQVLPFVVVGFVFLLLIFMVVIGGALGMDVHFTNPWQGSFELLAFTLLVIAAWTTRALAARRFRQDWRGPLLHPVGILLLLAVQWYSLGRKMMGGAVSWKDRAYSE